MSMTFFMRKPTSKPVEESTPPPDPETKTTTRRKAKEEGDAMLRDE